MVAKTMTRSFKRDATIAWNDEFGDLAIVKAMTIGRIVGPFYQGICLDRDSLNDGYYPTFHFSNIVCGRSIDEFDFHYRLSARSNLDTKITVSQHEKEFARYIELFRSQIPLPLDGELNSGELETSYKSFSATQFQNGQRNYSFPDFMFLLVLYIWTGATEKFHQCMTSCQRMLDSDPDYYETVREYPDYPFFSAARGYTRKDLDELLNGAIMRERFANVPVFQLA